MSSRDQRLTLYGPASDANAYQLRDFLSRSVVNYDAIDTNTDATALTQHPDWADQWPVCQLPDGNTITNATVDKIARHLGWVTQPRAAEYDLSIYGAGPAGLSAAVYAASEGLSVALVERHAVGGQASWTTRIENYLGFPGGISGGDLAERARQQAVAFGAEVLQLREGVKAVFRDGRIVVDLATGGTLTARANICATGVEYRRLDLDREQDFLNRGIYYGAGLSETTACTGRNVVIVGGGNSAGQAALHLSATSLNVDLLIRGDTPAASMSSYLLERLIDTDNITVRTNTSIIALHGVTNLQAIVVRDTSTETDTTIETSHVFVLIGGVPNTDWASETTIVRDPNGYLVTGHDLLTDGRPPAQWPLQRLPTLLETSVPGSFAVGDVRFGSTKRVASAVGEGAIAVHLVHRWLEERHRHTQPAEPEPNPATSTPK